MNFVGFGKLALEGSESVKFTLIWEIVGAK